MNTKNPTSNQEPVEGGDLNTEGNNTSVAGDTPNPQENQETAEAPAQGQQQEGGEDSQNQESTREQRILDKYSNNPEEVAKAYANSSDEAKRLYEKNRKLEQDAYNKDKRLAAADNSYLKEVMENDQETADKIANDLYGISAQDYFSTQDSEKPEVNEEELINKGKELAAREFQEKAVLEAVDSFLQEKNIEPDSDFENKFNEEYKFLSEGKQLTPESAKRILKTAYNNASLEMGNNHSSQKQELQSASFPSSSRKPLEKSTSKPSAPAANLYKGLGLNPTEVEKKLAERKSK